MLASCGGSRSGSTGAGGAGAASGQGGGSAIGGTDSVGLGCDGGCPADQYCSEIGSCIDDGTCAANGDCVEGLECDIASGLCVPGSECGGAEIDVTVVASNLLIELDRSCSMTAKVGGVKKWLIAANSLSKLTTQYASKIRFGLALFPDTVEPKCEQAAIAIPVAPDQESAIQSLMTASLAKNDPNYPNGPCVTNIDTAMKQAYEDPALDDPARPSYVLLVTDGKQAGCNAGGGFNGAVTYAEQLRTQKGVNTYVVGFGGEVSKNKLNELATAGGTALPDPVIKYYQADDQAGLDAALLSIASNAVGCVFQLDEAPDDPNDIFVFFNDDPTGIARDPSHMNGWDYDPMTQQITFYGAACDAIQSNTVSDVDIVFGCDKPTPN
jgi:hypothetical protein